MGAITGLCAQGEEVRSLANELDTPAITGRPARVTLPAGPFWFVVQTKPRAEQKAVEFLVRKAVSTFVPRLLVRHRHGSRRWDALEPLFPGYLFAHFFPLPHVISRVRWTPGVRRLLGDDAIPIPVPDDVMLYLQERQGPAGFITSGQPLRPGTPVRFRHGPFALLEGIIERPASRADRVRVLLTLVNRPIAVEAPIEDLEQA